MSRVNGGGVVVGSLKKRKKKMRRRTRVTFYHWRVLRCENQMEKRVLFSVFEAGAPLLLVLLFDDMYRPWFLSFCWEY